MTQTMKEELNQKIRALESQIDFVNATEPGNDSKIEALTKQIADIRIQIEEIDNEGRKQAHFDRLQQSLDLTATELDEIEFEGLKIRDLCLGPAEYQMVKIAVQSLISGSVGQLSEQIIKVQEEAAEQARAAEEREMNLKLQNTKLQQMLNQSEDKINDLQQSVNQCEDKINELTKVLGDEQELRKDAEQKRDNAANEIDGLRKQIETLRNEMADQAKKTYKVTTPEEQIQQLRQAAAEVKASRIPIYNKRQLDSSTYAANLAKTGEEITFNWTTEGKYYVMDESEVEQFRQTQQSAETYLPLDNGSAIQLPTLEIPSVTDTQPESQFQEITSEGHGMAETNESLEVAGKTLEERVAELEKRMAAVEENTTFGAVA